MAKPQIKKPSKNLNPYAKSKGSKIAKNKNRKNINEENDRIDDKNDYEIDSDFEDGPE